MTIAIVTGATSGLGRAFLQVWQEACAPFDEVWLVARHRAALEETARHLPWPSRLFALDLSREEARASLFAALAETQLRVSALVNSAGYGKVGPVVTAAPDDQTGMVALNCTALVDITQRVLPHMAPGGVIYEIASVAAFLPQPNFAVYAATKAFVLSYARALNAELHDRGVRVIAVCPNPMDTGFFDRAGTRPSLIKRLGFEAPHAVAKSAMRDAARGRDVSINSPLAAAIRCVAKVLPHRWMLWFERHVL